MDITQVSIIHHITLVLLLLWFLTCVGWAHPVVYFISLFYLYKVNERYTLRLQRRIQYEERKHANQRKILSDSETVRWLNHAVEKIWPICMEQIASQQFLLPIIPWFLEKYKPWSAKQAVVQHLYLGRNPPMFTEIRVLGESTDDDHLVLELGMNFLSGDDMSAVLAVQLRKRLGFGIRVNMHLTGMHVEGKVFVGVKFLREWPYLGRVRICFVEPPYFQMTVKPMFNHGVDVTELPGIAGWLDNMLAVAFEQTLVEPNMLVLDVEKFVSSPTDSWFTVDEKAPIAHAKAEIIEAADLKPSDLNGLADPYVKGHVGPYRFRTKTQKKTLAPKWLEEFMVPITSWEVPNLLVLELRDKDHLFDDMLGDCALNLNDLRGGQRHDKWLPLRNIKTGRCHLAITIIENEEDEVKEHQIEQHNDDDDGDLSKPTKQTTPRSNSTAQNPHDEEVSPESKNRIHMADVFEPINIEGQEKTGIWVHHPGSDISQSWEPRKGRERRPEMELYSEESTDSPRSAESGSHCSDTNNDDDGKKPRRLRTLRKGLHKIGSIFHSSSKSESPRQYRGEVIHTPRPNLRAVGEKGTAVRMIFDDCYDTNSGELKQDKESSSQEKGEGESESPKNGNVVKSAAAHISESALSRNGSAKFKEGQTSENDEREATRESDSGDALKHSAPAVGSTARLVENKESAECKDVDVTFGRVEEKLNMPNSEPDRKVTSQGTDSGETVCVVEDLKE